MSRMWRSAAIVIGVVVLQVGVFGVAGATHGSGGGEHPGHARACDNPGSASEKNPHCPDGDPHGENDDKPDPLQLPDLRDGDRDGDTKADAEDNCPDEANLRQTDSGGDERGDACTDDDDGDGVNDTADNCPETKNPNQHDGDGDGEGDVCDDDIDGDGVPNDLEPAAQTARRAARAAAQTLTGVQGMATEAVGV